MTKMSSRLRMSCAAALIAAATATPSASTSATADEPEWIRQFGTRTDDDARGVAIGRDGRVHVVGNTQGRFGASKGGFDGYVITFDADGSELWRRQPGTADFDLANGIAADADGNVYVVGGTDGALGGTNKGFVDAFLIKFDRNGRILWKRQPGTAGIDNARAVATDADGAVCVTGYTEGALGGANKGATDAFVIKFDHGGRILWKRQPGTTANDMAAGAATDVDGSVYVVGGTEGALGGANKGFMDAFVIKFDPDGRLLWKRQPGTGSFDEADGVAVDADGNVYVVGTTSGMLGGASAGGVDVFVIKFDRNGRLLWSRQPGTSAYDTAHGIATDVDGNVYIVGQTDGALGGPSQGNTDGFVIKLDREGHTLWSSQPSTTVLDVAKGVAADADGNAYVIGTTIGALGGASAGGSDGFLIKYAPGGPR